MDKLQESLEKMSGHETRAENEVTDLKKEVMSSKGLPCSRSSQNPAILTLFPAPLFHPGRWNQQQPHRLRDKIYKSFEEEGVVADA